MFPRRRYEPPGVLRLLLLAVSVWVLVHPPLLSQTTATGALTGEVLDPSGAVIPEAALRLTNQESNTVFSEVSAASTMISSPTFGVIRSTSVSSRVIQVALKFAF